MWLLSRGTLIIIQESGLQFGPNVHFSWLTDVEKGISLALFLYGRPILVRRCCVGLICIPFSDFCEDIVCEKLSENTINMRHYSQYLSKCIM